MSRWLKLAAVLTVFAIPWVPILPAHAAPPAGAQGEAPGASRGEAVPGAKTKARKRGKAVPAASPGKKPAGGVKKDAPKHGKEKKKTAARAGAGERRAGKKRPAPPAKPCLGPAVLIDRSGLEAERLALVDCAGKPREDARRALSVLARPWGAARPSQLPDPAPRAAPHAARPGAAQRAAAAADPAEIVPGVRLMDAGLLARIDALARKYPGKTVSLVSGYRPQSRGSLHQSARAVDMRIAGVRNEELAAACRALADTGCGYYPNSSFVHVDVRALGTGTVSWIDASGPGEPPRYVTSWPPPDDAGAPHNAAPDSASEAPEPESDALWFESPTESDPHH